MPNRFSITIKNDDYYVRLDAEAKKLGLNSKSEFYNFLTEQYFTGGSNNPELTVKQQIEKEKLELMLIKKPTEKLKFQEMVLSLWDKYKDRGYTLEQFNEMLKGELAELDKPENNFTRTPENVSKQFEPYGKTIIHDRIEEKSDGLDENNFCNFCNHTHADTEPKVCKDLHCNCGIRG